MAMFPWRKKRFDREPFNYAFEKIVANDLDVIGLLAYGFYKKSEVQWLESFSKEFGEDASESRITEWIRDHMTEENIQDYRKRAYDVVEQYRLLELNKAQGEVHVHIAATREKLEALTGVRGFFASVATGQISSLFSALLAALFSTWIASLWFSGLPLPGLRPRTGGGAARSASFPHQSQTVASPSNTKQ